jgi:hypothetical protein
LKIISLKTHGILDYITVLAFAVAPTLAGFSGVPAYICYALAAIHLSMTVMTNFPSGVIKVIPIRLHKIVETIVGPVLIILPWILGFSEDLAARYFFVAAGAVIIAVGFFTDYLETVSAV